MGTIILGILICCVVVLFINSSKSDSKKLGILGIIAAIIFFPFAVIMALAKNYK